MAQQIDSTEAQQTAAIVTYGALCQRHPDYDATYWRRLRAFYEGGKRLLSSDGIMQEVFPKHRNEHEQVYRERRARAFYLSYAAEIVDHIVAALTAEPIRMASPFEKELPPFYAKFVDDVSPPGGRRQSLNELLKDRVLTALQCRWSWVLVDLPSMRDETGAPRVFDSLAAQEEAGALAAYAVAIEPECLVDWEESEDGELEWALIHTVDAKRAGLAGTRGLVTERWTLYTRTEWQRFALTHEASKEPKATDAVPLVDGGTHSFGKVPLIRMTLPPGLWAMNKLEGPAREHFNKRCALAWAETQSLLPELYEFLGAEMPSAGAMIGANQEDPGRATVQPRGQGYVQVRGKDDKAAFVGPASEPFKYALESCRELRDEMHRITHQMALSVDNTGAALRRSADSKAQDKAATAVVLGALGGIVRRFAEAILDMVSRVRKDAALVGSWHARGMEEFDAADVAGLVEEATSLELVKLLSPAFQLIFRYKVARALLGEDATRQQLEAIEQELKENITDEEYSSGERDEPEDGARPPVRRRDSAANGGRPA